MLRETTSAATDAARLDDMETAHPADLGAELRDASPEIREAAVVRSRRLPEPDLMRGAWNSLPVGLQGQIGTAALTHSFYSREYQEKPFALTAETGARCEEVAYRALNAVEALAMTALPELYGTSEAEPAWALSDEPLSFPDPYAHLRAPTNMPPKVRAEAAARSRRIPGLAAILAAWSRLPPATQEQLGVQAVAVAFYGRLMDDAAQKPADRWLTDVAIERCNVRSDKALNLLAEIAERSMPELYGTKKRDPAWARLDADLAALDAVWEAALPSPMQFAIALHRRTWQALQASAAFLQASGKTAERMNVAWPAEDAEDEALTDLLMLSCRDRADAKTLLQHLTWYLGVRPQHPKRPALSQGDATLIALRIQGLGLILGKAAAGAAPVPEPGAMAGLIAAHRVAWSAFIAAPSREECEREDWWSLRLAADEAACAVLGGPCADRAEVAALVEHARWYAAELAAADEDRTDTLDFDAKNLAARAGDLAVYLGDSPAGGVPAGKA